VKILLLFALLWSAPAFAHKASDSYLALSVNGAVIDGQWDIALRDLDFAIGLDNDENGEITWGELKSHHGDITGYALSRLKLDADGHTCPAETTAHLVDEHTDGAYAVIRFTARCTNPVSALSVRYRLLFDLDAQHRGLLRLEHEGATVTAIFSPERSEQTFVLGEVSRFAQFMQYLKEGIWHIWMGFDHILFLLSLLLPAVLIYRENGWQPVARFREAFWEVLKIVTAFTIAHSITLTLATLGFVSLPSRLVESAIAVSVILAALNNVYPLFRGRRWTVAGAFGLIHGFGFASVLADLGLPQGALVLALFGFNLGVEVGQIAIVSLFLPAAYLMRGTRAYRTLVLLAGSVLIAAIAGVWFVERAFNVKLFVW